MREKKILWKSDLWTATLAFAAISAGCLAFLGLHLAKGETGEAFAMGVASVFPLTLTLLCAFTDRADALVSEVHPHVERDLLERSGVLEASFLDPDNPVNAERIARFKDKKRPPDIG